MAASTLRWTLLTGLGLALGIVLALLLQDPIEAVVGMVLVTPAVTLLVGAVLGAAQWVELRRHLRSAGRWLPATTVGLGAGLATGVVAVEVVGQALLGRPMRLLTLAPLPQVACLLLVGAIAGGLLGLIQRLWIRDLPRLWPLLSGVGLGLGLAVGGVLANSVFGTITAPPGLALLVVSGGLVLGGWTRRATRCAA
jgi:hypothetical protein